MGHFAKIENGIVTQVIAAEQNFIDSGVVGDASLWIQTSYNTREGIYYTPNTNIPDPDQSKALRKNYAGIGYTYDAALDAFVPPKPFFSWFLDTNTCQWKPPSPRPNDGKYYVWNEETQTWDFVSDN